MVSDVERDMPAILELDQGNTRCKWRLLAPSKDRSGGFSVVERGALARGPWWERDVLPAAWFLHPQPRVRVANVAGSEVERKISTCLRQQLCADVEFARVTAECAGVHCAYEEVHRLGVDRWLAVVAVHHRDPGPALVVDCGSAVTLDLLGGDGRHLGGYIVPGLGLMRRALYSDTDAVKVESAFAERMSLAPGENTADAVNRGLPMMVLGAIERAYDYLAHQCVLTGLPTPRLWMTGGDGALMASLCDRPSQLVEDLVMEGLAFTNP
ncbi:type III pantothenate kinase [Microbulbifer bruguierae]|uniref:Type III pantothenate kinase n=1 Tax=Microbulbifer bruguierae TaxID=3029061 RepID=A0ABY8NH91_9GAMM|nr:type III pantothenate kinase [Microbulbifer bruguierae]WGL18291.1 type III pantothenate kinase [Microbulbifer bruguierae]